MSFKQSCPWSAERCWATNYYLLQTNSQRANTQFWTKTTKFKREGNAKSICCIYPNIAGSIQRHIDWYFLGPYICHPLRPWDPILTFWSISSMDISKMISNNLQHHQLKWKKALPMVVHQFAYKSLPLAPPKSDRWPIWPELTELQKNIPCRVRDFFVIPNIFETEFNTKKTDKFWYRDVKLWCGPRSCIETFLASHPPPLAPWSPGPPD